MILKKTFDLTIRNIRLFAIVVAFVVTLISMTSVFGLYEPIDVSVVDRGVEAAVQEQADRESFEKVTTGESDSSKDVERAERYIRENISKCSDKLIFLNIIQLKINVLKQKGCKNSTYWEYVQSIQ